MMRQKNWYRYFLSLVVIWFGLGGEVSAAGLDKIIAIVDDGVITQSDFNQRLTMVRRQQPEGALQGKALEQQILSDLIDLQLQLQLAKRANIKVSDQDLDRQIAKIAQGNGLSLAQLQEAVQQREGMDFGTFRKRMRERMTIELLQQRAAAGEITVSEREVAAILRNPPRQGEASARYQVIDILFGMDEQQPSPAKLAALEKAAQAMATRLREGITLEKVVELAQRELGSKESVMVDRDWGWRHQNELPALFASAIVKLKVGQVAGPIVAPNGVHLLQLVDFEAAGGAVAKITQQQAREIAYFKKLEAWLKPWLQGMRARAYIKLFPVDQDTSRKIN